MWGGQMIKIRARSADGYLHIATKQGRKQPVRDVAEENRRKQVCLNCTKAKCSGTIECFRRMEARMRDCATNKHASKAWKDKVAKMSDKQIVAVYFRMIGR